MFQGNCLEGPSLWTFMNCEWCAEEIVCLNKWCAENGIDIAQQESQNAERVDKILPDPQQQKHDENDRIIPEQHIQDKLDAKKFNKLYRKIAMELHPDKDTGDADKFAKASDAYEKGFCHYCII